MLLNNHYLEREQETPKCLDGSIESDGNRYILLKINRCIKVWPLFVDCRCLWQSILGDKQNDKESYVIQDDRMGKPSISFLGAGGLFRSFAEFLFITSHMLVGRELVSSFVCFSFHAITFISPFFFEYLVIFLLFHILNIVKWKNFRPEFFGHWSFFLLHWVWKWCRIVTVGWQFSNRPKSTDGQGRSPVRQKERKKRERLVVITPLTFSLEGYDVREKKGEKKKKEKPSIQPVL